MFDKTYEEEGSRKVNKWLQFLEPTEHIGVWPLKGKNQPTEFISRINTCVVFFFFFTTQQLDSEERFILRNTWLSIVNS